MATKERKSTRDADGSIFKRIEKRNTGGGKSRKVTVYYARVRQNEYDENGKFVKCHELKRRVDTYDDAVIKRRQLRLELKEKIAAARLEKTLNRIYFFDLLDFYETHYVKEAVYSGSKKIAGQRAPLHQTKQKIRKFREFFGNVPVTSIDYARLFEFKLAIENEQYRIVRRVRVPKKGPREKQTYQLLEEWRDRKPATVHRYLACLRRVLYVGVQQGFATVNPFTLGDPLVQASVEETRNRICTFEEEDRILAECVPPRAHMRHVIICAIDTFARENELFSLTGADIDFAGRIVTIREKNSKTQTERSLPLSDRACESFLELKADRINDEWLSSPVFSFKSVKSAWYTILRKTEIEDLHFHDLRGTGITRMLDAGVPVPVVMKFSGHKKYETFMKYVKKDLQIMQEAAAAMSEHYRMRSKGQAKGKDGQATVIDLPNEQ